MKEIKLNMNKINKLITINIKTIKEDILKKYKIYLEEV